MDQRRILISQRVVMTIGSCAGSRDFQRRAKGVENCLKVGQLRRHLELDTSVLVRQYNPLLFQVGPPCAIRIGELDVHLHDSQPYLVLALEEGVVLAGLVFVVCERQGDVAGGGAVGDAFDVEGGGYRRACGPGLREDDFAGTIGVLPYLDAGVIDVGREGHTAGQADRCNLEFDRCQAVGAEAGVAAGVLLQRLVGIGDRAVAVGVDVKVDEHGAAAYCVERFAVRGFLTPGMDPEGELRNGIGWERRQGVFESALHVLSLEFTAARLNGLTVGSTLGVHQQEGFLGVPVESDVGVDAPAMREGGTSVAFVVVVRVPEQNMACVVDFVGIERNYDEARLLADKTMLNLYRAIRVHLYFSVSSFNALYIFIAPSESFLPFRIALSGASSGLFTAAFTASTNS